MEWNLYSIKVFSEVVRRKSFTKAAKSLGLTQPAVSLQVLNLEKQMGCPLMVRTRTGAITLTQAGQVLWRYSQKISELLRDLEKELRPWTSDRSRTVVVGCCSIAGEYVVPSYTIAFRQKRPQVNVQCHVGRCGDIFQRLLEGVLDLAFVGIPPDDFRLTQHPFVHMPLLCFEATRPSSRRLSIRHLVREPLILREEGSGTHRAFVGFLHSHNLRLDQFVLVATSESNEAIKEMVSRRLGWSILPEAVIEKELTLGRLSTIELHEGHPVQEFFVVYRKQEFLDGPQREFVRFLLESSPPMLRRHQSPPTS